MMDEWPLGYLLYLSMLDFFMEVCCDEPITCASSSVMLNSFLCSLARRARYCSFSISILLFRPSLVFREATFSAVCEANNFLGYKG